MSETRPPRIIPVEPSRPAWAAFMLSHASALALFAVALVFSLWVAVTNPDLVMAFTWLRAPWAFGGDFDLLGMAWAIIGVLLFAMIGWAYLEGLEIYIPRTARLALAFMFGLGLSGFVLECLAIPFKLTRPWVALALFALLLFLLARAWLRGRRLPESGLGGGREWREQVMRHVLARQAFRASLIRPSGFFARGWCALALALIGAITFFIFWHALLYPEVYWDSLILYLGYARQTFLAHGFPVKVTGQVGIGLGANYPHLFSVLGSGVAALAGQWSELPQRLIAPLAGLASTVLVYHAALRLTRHVGAALAVTLLYRATPLGIIYDQFASDYALVVLFTAAFLYLSLLYIETGLTGYLSSSALLAALAMHINYLMGILWVPWGLTLILAHTGAARRASWREAPAIAPLAAESPWTLLPSRLPLGRFLLSGRFWGIALLAAAIGSTWHIRNWIVTGNPVYAFFHKILDGEHINDEVMKAAAIEWTANGMGIGGLGHTLGERLAATWTYFTGLSQGRFIWKQYYQTAPLTLGFAAGGLLVWLGRLLGARARRLSSPVAWGVPLRFGFIPAVLCFGLLAFHYVLAPFYLYQVIGILPCLALLAALGWPIWRLAPWRWAGALLVLGVGAVPGLPCALMGYKIPNPDLFALRHPCPSAKMMYRWRFREDAFMWEFINNRLKEGWPIQRLLTHENRDLVLDPAIAIVNLDDWTREENIQALWNIPDPAERVRRLVVNHHIYFYLRVPNEAACPTNARMGTADWPRLGLAVLRHKEGGNELYELRCPSENGLTTASAAPLIVPRPKIQPPATSSGVPLRLTAPTTPTQSAPRPAPAPKPSPTPTPAPTPAPSPSPSPAPAPSPLPSPKPAAPTTTATQAAPTTATQHK